MSDLATVIKLFPIHKLIIRRLYRQVPEFRSLCDDYATAQCARDRWRLEEGKAREFEQLSNEVETEIAEAIEVALQRLHSRNQ